MNRVRWPSRILGATCVAAVAAFLGCGKPALQLPQQPDAAAPRESVAQTAQAAPLGHTGYLEQARRALADGDYREAARAAREAGRAAPDDAAARLLEAAALEAMGDLGEALALWRGVVERGPDDAEAWAAYAELAARRGSAAEALSVLVSRIGQRPEGDSLPSTLSGVAGWTALAAGYPDRAVAYLEPTRGTPDEDRFSLVLGRARLQIGDLAGAVAAADSGLAKDARSVDAWLLLGDARREMGLAAGAREAYQAVLERDADNYTARINMGALFLGQGEAEQALALFESATAARPGAPEAWHNLGLAHRLLGRWEAAREAYEAALRAAPGYPPTLKNLGILNEKYLGQPGAAVPFYGRYLEQVPGDEEVRRWLKTAQRLAAEAQGG